MTPARRAHDDRLLDALGEVEGQIYDGPVWRVVRKGRSAFEGSRGAGRWNPRDLDVLYCAEEADGAFRVAKLDIDDNIGTATKYGVTSIPTMILFKDGEPVERWIGIVPKETLLSSAREHASAVATVDN